MFPETDLYCITCEEHSRGRKNTEVVREMLDNGIRLIQYREKNKNVREKLRECEQIRRLTASADCKLIVNDDLGLALACGADGLHLGQDDLPLDRARMAAEERLFIGLSTHSPEQAREAIKHGADYIGVGPLYTTRTKEDVCAPVGLRYLRWAAGNCSLPLVAIGGIKLHNLPDVVRQGARCVAMVTEITEAEDIGGMIRRAREIINVSRTAQVQL